MDYTQFYTVYVYDYRLLELSYSNIHIIYMQQRYLPSFVCCRCCCFHGCLHIICRSFRSSLPIATCIIPISQYQLNRISYTSKAKSNSIHERHKNKKNQIIHSFIHSDDLFVRKCVPILILYISWCRIEENRVEKFYIKQIWLVIHLFITSFRDR